MTAVELTESQVNELPAFMQRVVEEQKNRNEEFSKLKVYVSNGCPGASPRAKELLKKQLTIMEDLVYTLGQRIKLYVEENTKNPKK